MIHKLLIIFSLSFILVFSIPSITEAHPGRTASDGCHYCRTNCDQWGVPWNERHCHGGGDSTSGGSSGSNSAPVQETVQTQEIGTLPTNTLIPLRLPTRTPTRIPTKTPTLTLTVALTPSSTATPPPTRAPTRKPQPVQSSAKAQKPQGFFAWLFSLFRGR
jgi:hypothetical protein